MVYELASYDLPITANDYTVSSQRCCRINNMENIVNSGSVGNTYTINIPGTSNAVANANTNSSPIFPINDTAAICQNSYFTYPFSATDPDGDVLQYTFCTGYTGGSDTNPIPSPASAPPYQAIPYAATFSGGNPLGAGVSINPTTGLISGIAPSITNTGEYVVTVCVSEYRSGLLIGETRKELHIVVRDCSLTKAVLNPASITCDGFTIDFKNEATNPPGIDYLWNFGDPATGNLNTSALAAPTHTFSDAGTYTLKLKVTFGGICPDSTNATIKVYPGFFPGFSSMAPFCVGTPVQFTDTTLVRYGAPTGWRWNFGDLKTTSDTLNNTPTPTYIYPAAGTYKVQLIVASTLGCIDTASANILINKQPDVKILNNDTLICYIDTLPLQAAAGTGNFSWSPNYNISSLSDANTLVSPDVDTDYIVAFTDALGCVNKDTVVVHVKNFVTLNARGDTSICRTDGLTLFNNSDALHYIWTPATYLSSDTAKQPFANPLAGNIIYHVVGNIGKCVAEDDVTITTLPYPAANAGSDTVVCFGTSASLSASGGLFYKWVPATFLSDSTIANPVAINPTITTRYIVTVLNNTGCPKPAFDTVVLTVVPQVFANAGPADTTMVVGEPLYLNATGGGNYEWSPSTWLSNTNIANPVANALDNITYRLKVTVGTGCSAFDSIRVKVYRVVPSFYMPSAFSPNNDGLNDILKPIALGMRRLDYFKVYDRWGRLVFSTSQIGSGWNGAFKGKLQDPATYVWMMQGTTYQNELIQRKGTVLLIR